ncbi:P-loop containing nucleoside triphosphate hydrolase protein [Lactarius akahatsu]|uniref:P-loop containing nucleoside triphosphate hydrolase protein n=1 Tax=Lactarius akahatsu TaxID=416441 RepID=A0AAD4LGW4_9AGAM|nr:P-loop containing nucleoside triphosphate hydrolase protein [Lactarius akahatsu]
MDLTSETLDKLLSTARSASAAPTAIPTPPFPGLSYLSSLHRGDIVEIQGPSGSGKTHLLYYLVCSCILPPHFGGWNRVSVIFDTDGSFDVHRLRALLQRRLTHYFPPHNDTTGQVISVALRNVHLFRPNSSSQLAAGLANLPSYHTSNLPTSEIALLAIDSINAFHWLDRFATERHRSAATPTLAQITLTALRNFHRSHRPIIVIVSWGPGVRAAFQLCKLHLPSFPTLINRGWPFPEAINDTHIPLTHQITLNPAHASPPPRNVAVSEGENEQRMSSLAQHVDILAHVKVAVDQGELLVMQIAQDRVVIRMANDSAPVSEGQ